MVLTAKDRLLVALDVDTLSKAEAIIKDLEGLTGPYKIGLEAISAGIAHELADMVIGAGGQVFWDGKWKDIPNTVTGAMKGLLKRHSDGICFANVHADGGVEMMAAAVADRGKTDVLAVTVLTSLHDLDCIRIYKDPAEKAVLNLAIDAHNAGVQGLICSPREAVMLREHFPELDLVTPAIRPDWAVAQDQARPTTPSQAMINGSTRIVVGRPIYGPPEGWTRRSAAESILEEMEKALEAVARG